MCDLALGAGASGAKLTGVGGGGCAIAIACTRKTADAVLEAWQRELYAVFRRPDWTAFGRGAASSTAIEKSDP